MGDDYQIFNIELGIGINGKVLKCQHRKSGRNCALKVSILYRQIFILFCFDLPQIVIDSDIARREVILHRKACKECPYIVQVLDVYVRIFVDVCTYRMKRAFLTTSAKHVSLKPMSVDHHGVVRIFSLAHRLFVTHHCDLVWRVASFSIVFSSAKLIRTRNEMLLISFG